MRVERAEGPTPFGGAYSEAVFLDDGTVVITEYAEDGTRLARTWGEWLPDEASPDGPNPRESSRAGASQTSGEGSTLPESG